MRIAVRVMRLLLQALGLEPLALRAQRLALLMRLELLVLRVLRQVPLPLRPQLQAQLAPRDQRKVQLVLRALQRRRHRRLRRLRPRVERPLQGQRLLYR